MHVAFDLFIISKPSCIMNYLIFLSAALTFYNIFNNLKLRSFGKILPYKWELLVNDYLSFYLP